MPSWPSKKSILVLLAICFAFILYFHDTIWSGSTDLGQHYALATRLADQRMLTADYPSLGVMNIYPRAAHIAAAGVGRLMGSTLPLGVFWTGVELCREKIWLRPDTLVLLQVAVLIGGNMRRWVESRKFASVISADFSLNTLSALSLEAALFLVTPGRKLLDVSDKVSLEKKLRAIGDELPHELGKSNAIIGLVGAPHLVDYMFSAGLLETSQRLGLRINGVDRGEVALSAPRGPDNPITFDISGIPAPAGYSLELRMPDATSLEKLGLSGDARQLGVNVGAIRFE